MHPCSQEERPHEIIEWTSIPVNSLNTVEWRVCRPLSSKFPELFPELRRCHRMIVLAPN